MAASIAINLINRRKVHFGAFESGRKQRSSSGIISCRQLSMETNCEIPQSHECRLDPCRATRKKRANGEFIIELFLPYLLFASPEIETCFDDGLGWERERVRERIMMFDNGNFDQELCTYLSNLLRFSHTTPGSFLRSQCQGKLPLSEPESSWVLHRKSSEDTALVSYLGNKPIQLSFQIITNSAQYWICFWILNMFCIHIYQFSLLLNVFFDCWLCFLSADYVSKFDCWLFSASNL